jgi:predicted permease
MQRIIALAWRSCAVLGVAWMLVAVMILAILAMVLLGYFGESSRGQYGALG